MTDIFNKGIFHRTLIQFQCGLNALEINAKKLGSVKLAMSSYTTCCLWRKFHEKIMEYVTLHELKNTSLGHQDSVG